jgi:flagellar biosynthetic protein FliR
MDLTSLGMEKLEVFLLVLARTAGIFTVAPIFGANQVPMQVKLGIALALAIVFTPLCRVAQLPATDVFPMALLIASQALVGLVIGFVAMLVFTAVQIAGEFIDLQAGFAFATMLDPVNGAQTAVASRFYHLLVGLLFFATNAHHIMIKGLADSFDLIPISQIALNAAVAGGIVDVFAGLFAVAIRIAMPVVAAVFLADLAMAIMSRAVPQMNILIVGLPLKLGVGMVGMLIALPVLASSSQGLFSNMYGQTGSILRLLGQ